MGILGSLLKFAAPIVGGAVAGPLGSAVGGSLGTAITGNLSSGLESAAGSYSDYQDQRAAQKAGDARYNSTFNQQIQLGNLANAQRIEAAQKQMDFQERMSNTAHQREVKDLYAAGLNPILSSKYGGSSTPGGAMAQIQDTHTPAASSAAARARQTLELQQMASSINLQSAQAQKLRAETLAVPSTRAATEKGIEGTQSQINLRGEQEALSRKQREKIGYELFKIKAETANTNQQFHIRKIEEDLKALDLTQARNREKIARDLGQLGQTFKDSPTVFKGIAQIIIQLLTQWGDKQ